MAITENEYTGNGSTVLYSFTFPYLEVADIKVSLDGTLTTAYTLANATTVQFNTAPANGVAIRLFRQTNDDALNAQFFPGSAIRSTDLNNNFTQNLYVTQESNRDATQGITTADAATATANTALSNSSAAVSTANTASSNASAAVSTANTASSNASAAVSTANTASSNATTAVSTANAATATANSAASDAATAISTANSALSTANTASTTATNAVNTANSASSAASSAVSTANTASSNASAAVSTANTASSNATSAVNTANSALSTANAAASAVANAILYDIVANVAAIPASPANNDAVEVTDSTGIESFTPLTSIPGGFAGNSGLSVRIVYTTTGNTWTWIQYFPNDPETRYLKEAVTTSDTAPVSPSDGDLWYDSVGGRTYVYYDDGDTSQWVDTSPQGSGVSDAISEGNTSAEVIDTGSDGRFVVTTEGSERLRITSAGLVGIGTNSPQDTLTVDTSIGVYRASSDPTLSFSVGGTVSAPTKSYRLLIDDSDSDKFQLRDGVTPRVTVDGSGNVGIGTTTPNVTGFGSTVATINVAAGSNGGLELTKNNVAAGHFTVESGASNDVRVGAVGGSAALTFQTGGAERARITSAGLVGIGTSGPDGLLHVASASAGTVTANGNANELVVENSSTGGISILTPDANHGYLIFGSPSDNEGAIIRYRHNDGIYTIGTEAAGGSIQLRSGSGTTALTIDSSQRVGIGTTSPGAALDVVGELYAGNGTITNYLTYSVGNSTGIVGTKTNHAFEIRTNNLERCRVDTSGRLLVGTSSARANFFNSNLSAAVQVEGTSSTDRRIAIVSSSTDVNGAQVVLAKQKSGSLGGNTIVAADDQLGSLSFQGSDGSQFVEAARIEGVVDNTPGANDMPSRLVFSTTADGASSPTERMRIRSNGDILAGSTSTWAPAGSGASFYIHNNSDQQTLRVSNGDPGSAPYGLIGFYRNKGSLIARISTDGSTVSYNTSSDYRLKENVTPVSDGITRLQQLKPSRFNFIVDPDKTVDGFLAHEVQTIVPEAITGEKDAVDDEGNPEYQGIDQSKLVPLLTAALQEAVARIEAQDTTIASLEARLTALEGGTN
jgi:hypothetical protein